MSPANPLGRFVWYELLTTDPEAAKSFYPTLTGWATQPWGEEQSYTLWINGGQPVGGLMALPDEVKAMGAPPHWIAYVSTPSVDDTVLAIESAGGTIHKSATDVPTVGRFAIIADPQGAVSGIYTSATSPEPAGTPKLGQFSWHELATTDPDAALAFYRDLFGWQQISAFDMGPMGSYHIYGQNSVPFGGIYRKPAEMPVAGWLYYVLVPSADDAARTAEKGGAKVINGPMEVPGGDRIAAFQDPQGAMFAVHSKKQ